MKLFTALLLILFNYFAFGQLNNFVITETPPPPNPPVFVNNPDDAAIIIYSSIKDLEFESNTDGIIRKITDLNKYTLLIKTERQYIKVKHREYMEDRISIPKLEARAALYFKIEPKEQRLAVVPVNIVTRPVAAQIYIDGEFKGVEKNQKLPPGVHKLRLVYEGYKTVERDIEVSDKNTLFEYTLTQVEQVGVEIRSVPDKAEIFLNNASRGETNRSLFLFPGEYDLKLVKDGYLEFERKITVSEDSILRFNFPLTRNASTLRVTLNPADAVLKLNGQVYSAGTIELTPSFYNVEVAKTGFLPVKDTLNLTLGETRVKNYTLSRNVGFLTLSLDPPNTEVYLNRERYYPQSSGRLDLGPGQYKIELRQQGYYDQSDIFEVELGKTITKSYTLTQIKGNLQFTVQPLDAEAELVRNGEVKYRWKGLKILKEIPVGNYELVCRYPGYGDYSKTVTVRENATVTEDVVMQIGTAGISKQDYKTPSTPVSASSGFAAKYYSVLLPGVGQIASGRNVGYLYTAAALGAGIYYLVSLSTYNDNVKDYNSEVSTYKSFPTAENKESARAALDKVNVSYSSTMLGLYLVAGAYAVNLVDALFFTKAPGASYSLTPQIDENRYALNFTWRF